MLIAGYSRCFRPIPHPLRTCVVRDARPCAALWAVGSAAAASASLGDVARSFTPMQGRLVPLRGVRSWLPRRFERSWPALPGHPSPRGEPTGHVRPRHGFRWSWIWNCGGSTDPRLGALHAGCACGRVGCCARRPRARRVTQPARRRCPLRVGAPGRNKTPITVDRVIGFRGASRRPALRPRNGCSVNCCYEHRRSQPYQG